MSEDVKSAEPTMFGNEQDAKRQAVKLSSVTNDEGKKSKFKVFECSANGTTKFVVAKSQSAAVNQFALANGVTIERKDYDLPPPPKEYLSMCSEEQIDELIEQLDKTTRGKKAA